MHTLRVKARDHRLIYTHQLLTEAFPQSSKHKEKTHVETGWLKHLALTLPIYGFCFTGAGGGVCRERKKYRRSSHAHICIHQIIIYAFDWDSIELNMPRVYISGHTTLIINNQVYATSFL